MNLIFIVVLYSCGEAPENKSANEYEHLEVSNGHYVGGPKIIDYNSHEDSQDHLPSMTFSNLPFEDTNCIDIDRESYLASSGLDYRSLTAEIIHHLEFDEENVSFKTVVKSFHNGDLVGISCNQALSHGYFVKVGNVYNIYFNLPESKSYLAYKLYKLNDKVTLEDVGN